MLICCLSWGDVVDWLLSGQHMRLLLLVRVLGLLHLRVDTIGIDRGGNWCHLHWLLIVLHFDVVDSAVLLVIVMMLGSAAMILSNLLCIVVENADEEGANEDNEEGVDQAEPPDRAVNEAIAAVPSDHILDQVAPIVGLCLHIVRNEQEPEQVHHHDDERSQVGEVKGVADHVVVSFDESCDECGSHDTVDGDSEVVARGDGRAQTAQVDDEDEDDADDDRTATAARIRWGSVVAR